MQEGRLSIITSLLLLLLVLPLEALAAITGYEEHLLNTQQQLPVSAIHSIYRDTEGYLWYGTVNGLCRDDGYNLQIFRPDFLQAQDKVVGTMVEDTRMHLWLGADNGLFWLDKHDYTIAPLCPQHWEGRRILSIVPTQNNRFWIQSRSHITLVDSVGNPLREYNKMDDEGNLISIWSMICYDDRQIVASFFDHTLASLDTLTGRWTDIPTPEPDDEIAQLALDQRQEGFWMLYSKGHIYHCRFEGQNLSFQAFSCDQKMGLFSYGLAHSPVDGTLWVMNTYGLRGYMPQDDCSLRMVYSSMEQTPKYHMLANILCDSLFTFVAAFDRPSYFLRPQENGLRHDPLTQLSDRVSFVSTVMALAEDSDDWQWVFQERTGLCLLNDRLNKVLLWTDFPQMLPYRLDKGRIIAPSCHGVWVNNDERLMVYRVERQGVEMKVSFELDLRDLAQPNEIVSTLYEDQSHRLWIGTNLGLYVYQTSPQASIVKMPKLGYVSGITPDKQGHYWVSTLEGKLYEFVDPQHYNVRLECEPLSTLCFMNDGSLWLGTQAGHIYRYYARNEEIKDYSDPCGMNGDRVNQLVADSYGHLWIETNQRIIEYNPRNNASQIYSTEEAEVPMRRFLPTAAMVDSKGRICFGGIPGIIRFDPSNRLDCESIPVSTYITDVRVMKHSLYFGNESFVERNYIELESSDRDLEIFFSSLDHYNVRHVRYAYRMVGVDKEWKYTVAGENSAFYNQLAKGNYTFEVKATDGNGLWSDHVAALHIRRLPAFYESTLAYICYILLSLGALLALVLAVHKRDEKKNEVMWSDSQAMLQMRNYLRNESNSAANGGDDRLPESEYRQLDQAFVQKVDQAIQTYLAESDFGVEELAAAVNVSKSTLSRKLKSITGQSPLDYIRQAKMRQACLWLQDKDRNVTEIAISLGYSDRKYFTSCFKKEFGQTPTEYRREKYGLRIDDEK